MLPESDKPEPVELSYATPCASKRRGASPIVRIVAGAAAIAFALLSLYLLTRGSSPDYSYSITACIVGVAFLACTAAGSIGR